MSFRRLIVIFVALLVCGLPGCMLKLALDTPSEPLERLSSDTTRISDAASDTADSIRTVSREVRAQLAPDLGTIYHRAAKIADKDRNPVIVIPGILGSRLVDANSEHVVWGEFGGDGIRAKTPAGAQLFAMPMQPGTHLNDIQTPVRVDGMLETMKINLLGLPIQLGACRDIQESLHVGGYVDEQPDAEGSAGHATCFHFAYDWRRDNAENAKRLHEFILEKKAYVERERIQRYGKTDAVRFDIVAHSMGALLARYYLMYGPAELRTDGTPPVLTWSGAQNVERLVQVGPPNAGAAQALHDLVHGVDFSKLLPSYDAALWGTMPAAYQLLPRTRHQSVILAANDEPVDVFDPSVWERFGWGLLDPRQDAVLKQLLPTIPDPQNRRRIAADHLKKCLALAATFQAAVDLPAAPPKGTSIHLIAGDAHPTIAKLKVQPDGGLEFAAKSPGDGSVTRDSALMDERLAEAPAWSPRVNSPIRFENVTFLFTDHRGLTADPAFTDNVLYLLLESPR